MYNIVSRMAVIAILGLISMPISGMEEQRAISERDAASKRQRVADRDPREAVTTAPERQTFKVERDEETEVPLQPVITNSQILEVLTGFRTLFGDRMDHIEAIMQAKFAENDVKLGVLMRAMAEIQRSLPPRLMPAPAAKAPARAQPKPASQPGPLPIHPPQFLQAQHSLGEQARPSNAAPGTLSFGLLAATNLPPQFLQANAAAATALAKLPPPQLLQAQQAPQSARPLPPQNPTTTQQRSCTYTETNDFVAHEEAINYVKQSANTTFSSSSDSLKSSNKDAVCQVIKRHPCAASCVELYESGAGVRPLHLCIGSLLDNTVKVMIGNGSVKTFAGHAGRVNYVSAYTMDGRKATHILSASADNTIKLWDLENDLLVRTFSGHTGSVNALCRIELLSQKCIVSGSADMSIKIWDILDGKLIRTISGHEGSVDCLEVIDAGFQRKLSFLVLLMELLDYGAKRGRDSARFPMGKQCIL